MGNYVWETRSKGEQIIKEAKFHWIKYFWPVCFAIASACYIYYIVNDEYLINSWTLFPTLVLILSLYYLFELLADEVTLTNQRLIAKRGLFSRKTLDLQLSEVESISADLPFFTHSFFRIGTIIIRGTGGSSIAVPGIKEVLGYRKIIQDTLNAKRANAGIVQLEKVEQQNNGKYESSEKIDLLLKLKRLLDGGVISMEEFQRERDKIMGKNS